MNYRDIGLKVGFEFHQQLDTETKLFCDCPNELKEKQKTFEIKRNLHPTKSELGEVDRAALEEARLKRDFFYEGFEENTCLVETDEEPPHPLNKNALDIAIEVSLLLDAKLVDVVHIMRKIVIDGSNTAGFQRTALVSTDGEIRTDEGKIGIDGISLEEESAQKIEGGLKDEKIRFNLQRLGVPLIEIGSDPDIKTPEQARKFAEKIGMILRSTRKVKRGIGTIRQDLNISIEEGSRIELKGVQELDLIEEYIKQEIKRQINLIEIREELKERGVKEVKGEIVDVSQLFKESSSEILRKGLEKGKVLAINLKNFRGLVGKEIQAERRLGTEFSDRAKKAGGVGGIFHTDELPSYGITQKEVKELRDEMGSNKNDCVVIVADEEEKAIKALQAVRKRAKECLKGVPEETRRPLDTGGSEYMRPLPGSARMYPETDIPAVELKREKIEEIRDNLPELIKNKMKRYKEKYGLDKGKARDIAKSKKSEVFEDIIEETEIKETIIYKTLMSHLPEIQKEGINTSKIQNKHLIKLFKLLDKNRFSKENIEDLLKYIAKEPRKDIESIIKERNLAKIGEEKIRETINKVIEEKSKLIEEKGMGAIGPLMGVIMDRLNRRADGDTVSEILKSKIKEEIGREGCG